MPVRPHIRSRLRGDQQALHLIVRAGMKQKVGP
jgi:hypothetical protein